VVAREDGGVGDGLGDHRLAKALPRDQDDVARRGEEVEREDSLDGGAIDALGPGPVEVTHRGEAADAAAQQAATRALLLFGLDEVLEELRGAPTDA
jgi:hypothetical protein